MPARMRSPAILVVGLLALGCGQKPGPFEFNPNAELAPPTVKVTPPPGLFNGELTITLESDRPATIFVTTNGQDPRMTTEGRTSGESPFTVTITATSTLKYFASVGGKDSELGEGLWTRAGGPVGTISGVVVVGSYAVGKAVGLFRNTELVRLGTPDMPTEIPFQFTGLSTGTHRLTAISDRNEDGQLIPFLDYQSATTSIDLDTSDPTRAGPENVRIYLGASGTGLGTLRGTISLPNPPTLQSLQISLLDPGALSGGLDPTTLLQQLQAGYQILTTPMQSEYPYVITDLEPGNVMPVPSLIGFGNGGVAINLLANPLQTVTIRADEETVADFAFGPVTINGTVTLGPQSAPDGGGLNIGIVAARGASFTQGIQAVLMPVLFVGDPMTGALRAGYAGSAFRSNTSVSLRVFSGASAITDALTWVVNPFASLPGQATVQTGTVDVTRDITVP